MFSRCFNFYTLMECPGCVAPRPKNICRDNNSQEHQEQALAYEERLRILKLYPLSKKTDRSVQILYRSRKHQARGVLHLLAQHWNHTAGGTISSCPRKDYLKKGLELRKYFFSQRIVDKRNKLPLSVVNAKTTNQFKNIGSTNTAPKMDMGPIDMLNNRLTVTPIGYIKYPSNLKYK